MHLSSRPPEPPPGAAQLAESPWIAIRATLIVMPTYLLALSNPGMYLAIVMKAVTLGQRAVEAHGPTKAPLSALALSLAACQDDAVPRDDARARG